MITSAQDGRNARDGVKRTEALDLEVELRLGVTFDGVPILTRTGLLHQPVVLLRGGHCATHSRTS